MFKSLEHRQRSSVELFLSHYYPVLLYNSEFMYWIVSFPVFVTPRSFPPSSLARTLTPYFCSRSPLFARTSSEFRGSGRYRVVACIRRSGGRASTIGSVPSAVKAQPTTLTAACFGWRRQSPGQVGSTMSDAPSTSKAPETRLTAVVKTPTNVCLVSVVKIVV